LDQVIDHFDRHYELKLSSADRNNLVAYLQTLAGQTDMAAVTVESDIETIDETLWVVTGAVERRLVDITSIAVGVARRELGAIHERFQFGDEADDAPAARAALVELSVGARAIERSAELRDWRAATELARRLSERLVEVRPTLISAAPNSLYDAGRRRKFFASRAKN
jgi:hypothetical protein